MLQNAGLPCGPNHNVNEALNMPKISAQDMVIEFEVSSVRGLSDSIKLSAIPVRNEIPPLQLGSSIEKS